MRNTVWGVAKKVCGLKLGLQVPGEGYVDQWDFSSYYRYCVVKVTLIQILSFSFP